MGRPPRRSGHLAGTFVPPDIQPSQQPVQGNVHRSFSSTQPQYSRPLFVQPPQPQVTIPIRQQTWQSGSSQFGGYLAPDVCTPSTTDAVSPVSSRATLSPSTSYTTGLGNFRQLSPEVLTPTSSAAIASPYRDFYQHEPQLGQHQQATTRAIDFVSVPTHAIRDDVMGIEPQETAPFIAHSPRFLSAKTPSPTRYQRYPGITEPWSAETLRQDDIYVGMDTSPPQMMDYVLDNAQSTTPREKGGGRTGPLSQEQRQHASEVRKNGSCLRCSIMKEKCDLKSPCTTCSSKDRRKAPKSCVPRQFDWERFGQTIFPDELTTRLRSKNLFRSLANCSFAVSNRPTFQISLDMHIGIPISVMVREFDPLLSAHDIRHAYQATKDANGNSSLEKRPVWNPPIIMYIRDGELPRQRAVIQAKVIKVFDQLLDDTKAFDKWTRNMTFPHQEEGFQRDILQRIFRYYRKKLDQHSILRTALSLLWFEYLLMVKFTIPDETLPEFESHLGARRPYESFDYVIPDTINTFLKAIILPLAEDAAKKLMEYLHDLLFKLAVTPKSSTTGQSDIALCLSFILKLFLGRTQATLLLLVGAPPTEDYDKEYTKKNAAETIRKMESVADYFVSLHQYTLSRKACRSPAVPTGIESPFETHARKFDLECGLDQEVARKYADQRPKSLKIEMVDFNDSFRYENVRRQCWRVFTNVRSDN